MLGCAALGNLLQGYGEGFHAVFGIVAVLLGLLFVAKLIGDNESVQNDMKNPMLASISGTFSMALLLLAGYAKPLSAEFGIVLWWTGLALHICLIVWFTVKYVAHFDLRQVFPSWHIVYVGIAAASVTVPAFGMEAIGTACFWFGLVTFAILTFVIVRRYTKVGEPPVPARPVFCIMTAPASLCVAAYVQSVTPKSLVLLACMEVVATVLYAVVLLRLPRFLKVTAFAPSYAAYTFPFVITAIALKQTMACVAALGSPAPWLAPLVLAETIIATVLVLYALVRFLMHIFGDGGPRHRKPRMPHEPYLPIGD
jgi:exfoliative toxin A/B